MTSLDPSHIPFSKSAQAVHHVETSASDDKSSKFPDTLPTVRQRHEGGRGHRKGKGKHSEGEGRERVRQAMPPMPDLRFEQSFLLSIRPYLTPRPTIKTIEEKGSMPSGASHNESKSLVSGAEDDQVFHWGRQVDVDWKQVGWVTLRDQIVSPLLQGMIWGWATLFLASTGAVLRSSLYPASHIPKGRIAGGGGAGSKPDAGGKVVGEGGWWKNWVGSWFGGVETATV
ncbi:hypothetical protein I317_06732 [Kwoniella heveanensis CBS 569]|nr:hypothetical protein I317_06732 [Kwoniella heveanensis CBS 569]